MTKTFQLPALKSLGELAGVEPVIIVDSREQDPLRFSRLKSTTGTLYSSDYSVAGLEHLFAVERKTVSDLVNCCVGQNRERFERELHRFRGYRFKRLLIVGSETDIQQCRYRSGVTPKAVFSTLSAFEVRFDCPVSFRPAPELAARQIESWAFWFAREMVQIVNGFCRASCSTQN